MQLGQNFASRGIERNATIILCPKVATTDGKSAVESEKVQAKEKNCDSSFVHIARCPRISFCKPSALNARHPLKYAELVASKLRLSMAAHCYFSLSSTYNGNRKIYLNARIVTTNTTNGGVSLLSCRSCVKSRGV